MTMGGRWAGRFRALPDVIVRRAVAAWNRAVTRLRGAEPPDPHEPAGLREVRARARARRTDISRHLPTLYLEAVAASPRLIVELGTRGGDSTFVWERVAALTGATVLSVDVDDCSHVSSFPGWHFVRSDDVAFAAAFPDWCRERGIEPRVDVLFVDTSHALEHTRAELAAWLPLLAPRGRAIFHDTNMRAFYRRGDGTVGLGSTVNARGVMEALEERLGRPLDERRPLHLLAGGWVVRHDPLCSGLTVLERVSPPGKAGADG
ncbi:MAG: class I SAM-dependent methyltransferase [Gemmatimonadetes bacterium]|nr:class I SAM-dependent methyltransferase [Gemmatimonadota bacterium]